MTTQYPAKHFILCTYKISMLDKWQFHC